MIRPLGKLLWDGVVLGIETSCDETSVAVLDGLEVRANVVTSQAELHRKWGGIVPEAASRAHVEALLPAVEEALERAGAKLDDLGAIAVTNRPGLVGALSVGTTAAKALGFALDVPVVGVHHLEGHVLSPLFASSDLPLEHLCLLVSGGHTELVRVQGWGAYALLGQTRDDAAGEAFDKGARLLGLGYPGGKAIEDAANSGNPARYSLPRGLASEATLDFSFSGLKTAMWRLVQSEGAALSVPDAAASLQAAIVDSLAEKAMLAADRLDVTTLTLAGGVAANRALRDRLAAECEKRDVRFVPAPLEFCTDNAAMIAVAGSFRLAEGERSGLDLDVFANAPLP